MRGGRIYTKPLMRCLDQTFSESIDLEDLRVKHVINLASQPKSILPLVLMARDAIVRKLPVAVHMVVLFGSEARGEGTSESDIDLLIVLEENDRQTVERVQDVVYDVMWEDGFTRLISVTPMSRSQWEYQKLKGFSFVQNVEEDGIVLWQAA